MHWEVGEVALFLLKLGHVASANWLLLIMQDTCQTESHPAITSRDWGTVFCAVRRVCRAVGEWLEW